MINRLLDGFEGKLTNAKWATMAKTSPETALCEIKDLIRRSVLEKDSDGGRSTGYLLVEEVEIMNHEVCI